jgi:hypothetical protein
MSVDVNFHENLLIPSSVLLSNGELKSAVVPMFTALTLGSVR